ncbi:stage III sporulation protein AF [Bacillus sp. FJAT-44742]|uniref:stage III sporulation protein AF n=1 Tax=Bacillus sp. FJAT-44742 TaxID=2014005 RepID=UPI000C230814|nr:stage III sporulation protein AF [Bacillus sp. FJAT-44742]
MEYLTDWVTTLIVFILVAVLIEMLMPSSKFQRYIRLCLSLTLMVIILQPLFDLFQRDIHSFLPEYYEEEIVSAEWMEEKMIQKKTEIQAGQDAYISEQMAEQMELQVAEEVEKKWNMELTRVEVEFLEDVNADTIDPSQAFFVHVTLNEKKQEGAVEAIAPIHIQTEPENEQSSPPSSLREIERFLASNWEVEEQNLSIEMEGGRFP